MSQNEKKKQIIFKQIKEMEMKLSLERVSHDQINQENQIFSFVQIDSETSNYKFSFRSYTFFLDLLDNIR